jgi:hypothetical protein
MSQTKYLEMLPKEPLSTQIHNKTMWNLQRIKFNYDFYTIGYEKTKTDNFIEKLASRNVSLKF